MSNQDNTKKFWLDGTGTTNKHDNAPKATSLEKHTYYIYLTTNQITGTNYVGMHRCDSKEEWRTYMGSGTYLKVEADGYGVENFSKQLLAYAETALEAKFLEARFIAKALTKDAYCYNANQSEAVNRDLPTGNLKHFAFKASFRGRQRLEYNLALTEQAIAGGLDYADHDDLSELLEGWKLALRIKDARFKATGRLDQKDWCEQKWGFNPNDSRD